MSGGRFPGIIKSADMVNLKVRKERAGPIRGRHPWVFSGALEAVPEGLRSGDPVVLTDEKGAFLAHGYFNSYSQIAVRIWGYEKDETIDKDFFLNKIRRASGIREGLIPEDTDSYRLINGEGDFLPALIVDRYADNLVMQFHTEGIARWREEIAGALIEAINPKGIYEKPPKDGAAGGVIYGEVPEKITIKENGLSFIIDVRGGQKTGFYLDQRDKRLSLMKYAPGRKCLNCFSYTGAFTVYALAGGASGVLSVDASAPALELAKENVRLNGLDINKCSFVCDDARHYLKETPQGKFDLIVLDPPAFIKDRRKIKEGMSGYGGINEASLRILPDGGVLVSSSCSAHLGLQEFRYVLSEAGGRAGKSVQILETHTHGLDHPVPVPFTEGQYLKCFFLKVSP